MGLFDYVRCEINLPRPLNEGELRGVKWEEKQLQTKDLGDPALKHYLIDSNGLLWEEGPVSGEKRKNSASCDVHIYDYIFGDKFNYWVEWRARFSEGVCKSLELEKWRETESIYEHNSTRQQ